jgi:hypothetical protein
LALSSQFSRPLSSSPSLKHLSVLSHLSAWLQGEREKKSGK